MAYATGVLELPEMGATPEAEVLPGHTPLGSPWVPLHRATVGSYGGGTSYGRGTPVQVPGMLLLSEEETT